MTYRRQEETRPRRRWKVSRRGEAGSRLGARKEPRTVRGLELETGGRDRRGEEGRAWWVGWGQNTGHGASAVETCLSVWATELTLQR